MSGGNWSYHPYSRDSLFLAGGLNRIVERPKHDQRHNIAAKCYRDMSRWLMLVQKPPTDDKRFQIGN